MIAEGGCTGQPQPQGNIPNPFYLTILFRYLSEFRTIYPFQFSSLKV